MEEHDRKDDGRGQLACPVCLPEYNGIGQWKEAIGEDKHGGQAEIGDQSNSCALRGSILILDGQATSSVLN
jgi:hypothetical protein